MNRYLMGLARNKAAPGAALAGLACFALLMTIPAAAGPVKIARSPADLAATISVRQEQGITQWFVRGVATNIGGRDYRFGPDGVPPGARTITLQQITVRRGPLGPTKKVVSLATKKVRYLKAGDTVVLSTVLTKEPVAGTVFRLVISPGDGSPENDQADKRYPR